MDALPVQEGNPPTIDSLQEAMERLEAIINDKERNGEEATRDLYEAYANLCRQCVEIETACYTAV